ncbi:MAG: hypothetical protein ACXAAO_07005 [Candidatus Thorarchaeota archaeon]|jgi:hypothetical protein
MNTELEDKDEQAEEEKDIDWLDYASQEEGTALRPLDRKDYLALFIASLQTIFLPLMILIIVLVAINFLLQIFVGGQI